MPTAALRGPYPKRRSIMVGPVLDIGDVLENCRDALFDRVNGLQLSFGPVQPLGNRFSFDQHAAWLIDQGHDAREQIAMVKVHAAETLGRVVDRAVQVFGGMGFCKELPIERYYRDARIYRIFDGTSEIHRTVIAKSVMKKGASLHDLHR
mgnify:CR=1 FL=1